MPDGIAIGDPARIIKAIKVWEAIGVDAVNFVMNTAEVVPQEDVLARATATTGRRDGSPSTEGWPCSPATLLPAPFAVRSPVHLDDASGPARPGPPIAAGRT